MRTSSFLALLIGIATAACSSGTGGTGTTGGGTSSGNSLAGPSDLAFNVSFAGYALTPFCSDIEGSPCTDNGTFQLFFSDVDHTAQCGSDGGITYQPNERFLLVTVVNNAVSQEGSVIVDGGYTLSGTSGPAISEIVARTAEGDGGLPEYAQADSVSGTVDLESVANPAVGTFSAVMNTDTMHSYTDGGETLTGTFSATLCPALGN